MSTHSSPESPLPEVVREYFTAVNEARIDDATAIFAWDARVHDENHDHAGQAAIREWIADTTQKYHPQNEILHSREDGETLVVTAKVSGTFPGSPVELDFVFMHGHGKIIRLSIQ